jgi:glycosyltransferase involved in cell wall biosynthesis
VEQYGTSKLVDVSDPSSIAQAVNSFLGDTKEYDRYSKNVRKAFESEFNFEKQFEPVFKWLDSQKV